MPDSISVHDTASQLYADAGWLVRNLQRGRPYICPFEPMIDQVPQGAAVFDIGCGAGLFALHMINSRRASSVIGVDLSREAIATAKRAAANLPEDLRESAAFDCVDGLDDWPAGPFDVISMVDMMHHVPRELRADLFGAAAKRLNRGGAIIYKDMRKRPRWRAAMNQLHDLVMARQLISHCGRREVVEWAEASGLTMRWHAEYDAAWYAHELIVFSK